MTDPRTDLVQRMMAVADDLYVPRVHRTFKDEGVSCLRRLLAAIRSLYHWIPPETFKDGLVVFVPLTDDPPPVAASAIVAPSRLAQMRLQAATIRVESDGQLRVWAEASNTSELAANAVLYHFRYLDAPAQSIEQIMFGANVAVVPNMSGFPSAFAVPSFADLGEALRHLGHIIDAPDPYIEEAWRDKNRIAFLPKPERHMRRAVELFLRHTLRGAVVRPEQNVNETEPVDIEVSWDYQGRLAWIEIKWLGHSAPDGATKWKTSYYESRAVEGAWQLANYLDSGARRVTVPVMGYLLVFDARRRSVQPADQVVDSARGLYYQLRDVDYPAEINARSNMAKPIRYFLAPRCMELASAV